MNPWEGKHIWIWELSSCGNPTDVVNKAVSLGLSGLLIKGWDGSNYWQQIESIINLAHNAELIVGAWGYSYGKDWWGELRAVKKVVEAGVDWLIVDAESEYKTASGKNAALRLGDVFRSAFGTLPIGYTSFGIPDLHTNFPWQEFSSWCNVVLPQIYWQDFGWSVDYSLSRSLVGLKQYNLPILPAGQIYGAVTSDEIIRFGDLVETAGLPGISYYSWQHASSERLEAVGVAPYKKAMQTIVSEWAKASWAKSVALELHSNSDPQGVVTREMFDVMLDKLGLLEAAGQVPQSVVDAMKAVDIIKDDHPVNARVTWGELAAVITNLQRKRKEQ
ncbi:MAG: hypothetical protein ACYC6C_12665 [Coriobacteriia bacterium]